MAMLAIIPSLPARSVAEGRVLLTKKFVDGMARMTMLWGGPVVAIMRPHTAASTGNLDDAEFDLDQLPFSVRIVPYTGNHIYTALADADAVMLGGDHRLANLTQWCRSQGKKTVFVTEYSLRTRLQIIDAEVTNPVIRYRRYLWAWHQERRNLRGITAADAVQCNGTPTYDIYRKINGNTLLFFDNRMTVDMLADRKAVAARLADMDRNTHLRIAYSGRLTAVKGGDDLIEVARHLKNAGLDFSFDIYGEGDLRPIMEERIRAYGLGDRVRLHGVVDFATELLPAVRSHIDLFVCCHRQGDPSCTYLETLGCGVPVVGYANDALCGLTKGRAIGWTTPINDARQLAKKIADLQAHPEQLSRASFEALAFATEHTFEKEFAARIAQVRKLLDGPPSPLKELPLAKPARKDQKNVDRG